MNLFQNFDALIFQFQFCVISYIFLEENLNTIHSGYLCHCYDFDIIETDLNEGSSSSEMKLAFNISWNLSGTRLESCCRALLVFNAEFSVKN